MINCLCGSQKKYFSCCEPYISGKELPATPEALMRSRYTAYSLVNIDYIQKTMSGKAAIGFQYLDAVRFAKKVIWIKLNVLRSGMENSNKGYVEFEACFIEGRRIKYMHEKSEFVRELGRLYYVDGIHLPICHKEQMISQNMSCPCGSLRKFKNCHGVTQ